MAVLAFAIASEPMLDPAADSPPPRSDVISVCRHPAEARVAPWPTVF